MSRGFSDEEVREVYAGGGEPTTGDLACRRTARRSGRAERQGQFAALAVARRARLAQRVAPRCMGIGRRPYRGMELGERIRIVDQPHLLLIAEGGRAGSERGSHEMAALGAQRGGDS